jgi:hypothetical protein
VLRDERGEALAEDVLLVAGGHDDGELVRTVVWRRFGRRGRGGRVGTRWVGIVEEAERRWAMRRHRFVL